MTIQEVYEKFNIPPNLQQHMLSVAKVGKFIQEHWIGDQIDWDSILKAALLHDLGNVVRFDFEKYPQFLGDEQNNIDHWKEVQQDMIRKYGLDDHDVTKRILEELSIDPSTIDTILNKSFGNSVKIAKSNDWYTKILHYSDMRVIPEGIATLEDRFQDIRKRGTKYIDRPDFEDLLDACRTIEKQIQSSIDGDLNQIESKDNNEELLMTSI